MNSSALAIALVVFLTVTLGMAVACQACFRFLDRDSERVRGRMVAAFSNGQRTGKHTGNHSALFPNADQLPLDEEEVEKNSTSASVVPRAKKTKAADLGKTLLQAQVGMNTRQFLWLTAGLCGGVALAVWLYFGMLVGLAAGLMAAAAPFVFVSTKRKRMEAKLLEQLPNAFDLMARVIRAGQSVPQALNAVAETFENPIAGELASCQKQQNLGLRIEVTFQELVQRWDILELRIFAMAMMIQRQTGGNLSEVLDRLSGLIRARLRLQKQVKAWTAEGRLQGWTLAVLPFFMFGVLMIVNRAYVQTLFQHVSLIILTLVLMALGILWIRRIVRFRY